MSRTRVFLLPAAALAAAAATLGLRAQGRDRSLVVREGVGLPAVYEGFVTDTTHTPGTVETARRIAVHDLQHTDGVGASGIPYARGRVIVKFRDGATAAARADAIAGASRTAAIVSRPSYANFDVVRFADNEDAEGVARKLAERPEVEYAQPAYRIHTRFVPNDPGYKEIQWNLPLIGMEAAWDIQPQAGSAITVAVLDTGMAYANATLTVNIPAWVDDSGVHYPALGRVTIPYSAATQLITPNRIVAPHDFIWDNNQPLDYDGHGTHVAGTIGQLTNDGVGLAGIAFNGKLMPIKVIDSMWDDLFGAPNAGTDLEVARGIRYAADNGAKVINMSIGRTGPPDTAPAVEEAINYAVNKGVFLAIAGGNLFEEGNPKEVLAEIASRVKGAVSVAAIDRNATVGDHRCTGSSSSPSCHAWYSTTGSWVELSAPGGSERGYGRDGFIWQQTLDFRFVETYLLPVNEYRAPRFDILADIGYIGTSMATPHVAGVAAMMIQQGITDPAAVEAALERFATDLGTPGRDDTYGYGLIDAQSSLRGLGLAR
jgi:serine protease